MVGTSHPHQTHRHPPRQTDAARTLPVQCSETGKIWGNGGKWVKMCRFWKTEWKNGDKPPRKRRKTVVFSADGSQGVRILGNGRRKKRGEMGEIGGK